MLIMVVVDDIFFDGMGEFGDEVMVVGFVAEFGSDGI